jgi:three-Cys-motif partner protein
MPDERETIWLAPAHTLAKHQILRQYLVAWLPIMLRKYPHVVYIDGFAGPGIYVGGEPGSPIIALKIAAEHQRLHADPPKHGVDLFFIEERADRFQRLEAEIADLFRKTSLPHWVAKHPIHGTFEIEADHILVNLPKLSGPSPRFVFADPFGYGDLPMRTLARLMEAPSSEVLIFFDYADIYRFLRDSTKANALDRLYLSEGWHQYAQEPDERKQREGLLNLYGQQLKKHARFNFVWPFELVDVRSGHYFLIFGTRSKEGLRRMKSAYWKVDPERGRYFVDPKHPEQVALLPAKSSLEQLPGILRRRFRGEWVPIELVADFVLAGTDFVDDMHLRRKTLQRMEQVSPPQILIRGRRRDIAGQYPFGTQIHFL